MILFRKRLIKEIFYFLRLKNNNKSLFTVKEMHKRLTYKLQYDCGEFKENRNKIKGADFDTALPFQVPELMNQWAENTKFRLAQATTDDEIIKVVLDQYIIFERIHPFSDGNDKTK